MLPADLEDTLRIVQNKQTESAAYLKQLHIWLGAGSAGGAISMVSLASNLDNPAYALHFMHVSLWLFLVGVVTAGMSLFLLSSRLSSMSYHFACAHNREQLNLAINKIPEVISSPPQIAVEANTHRNLLIKQSHREHERAEAAWKNQKTFNIGWGCCIILSAASFVLAFAWLLIKISLGYTLTPV